ncbi:MAG: hypothetical protein AB9836_14015 [Aminipila sp.]
MRYNLIIFRKGQVGKEGKEGKIMRVKFSQGNIMIEEKRMCCPDDNE